MLADSINEYKTELIAKGYSDNTRKAYLADIEQFYSFLKQFFPDGKIPLKDLNGTMVKDFINQLQQEKKSSTTISRKSTTLSRYFQFLVEQNKISENFIDAVKKPVKELPKPPKPSVRAVKRLLHIKEDNSKFGIRNRVMLELFFTCGLRVCEIANCKLSDLYLNAGLIRTNNRENNKKFTTLNNHSKELIARYLEVRYRFLSENSEDFLFLSKYGTPLETEELTTIFDRFMQITAQKHGYDIKTVKCTFADHLLAQGADLKAVQEILGHEDTAATEKYAKEKFPEIFQRA